MKVSELLKGSFNLLKGNIVIALPAAIANILNLLLIERALISRLRTDNTGELSPEQIFSHMGSLLAVFLIKGVVDLLAHGSAIGMANEAMKKGRTSISSMVLSIKANFSSFIIAGFIVSLFATMGFMVYIIPGLIFMFFVIFTFPAIVVEGLSPLEAIKRSTKIVTSRVSDAFLFFVIFIALHMASGFIGVQLSTVPVFGQFLWIAVTGLLGGFASIYVLKGFIEFTKKVPESD